VVAERRVEGNTTICFHIKVNILPPVLMLLLMLVVTPDCDVCTVRPSLHLVGLLIKARLFVTPLPCVAHQLSLLHVDTNIFLCEHFQGSILQLSITAACRAVPCCVVLCRAAAGQQLGGLQLPQVPPKPLPRWVLAGVVCDVATKTELCRFHSSL
jgi:hypothetical protein